MTTAIEDKFRDSLVNRAKKRVVIAASPGRWLVRGESGLGDAYPRYTVTLGEGERRYTCSCYSNNYGEHRRHTICSHVLAVILYRRNRRDEDKRGEGGMDAGAVGVPQTVILPPPSLPTIPTRDDPMWGLTPLPSFIHAIHPHQWQAVQEIVEAFKSGKRFVWLDAPTGSGKTLIAELVRRIMDLDAAYVCSSKSLQDQFVHDYPYAMLLKGRSNYPTTDWPYPQYTAADCSKSPNIPDSCTWCENSFKCPYEVAKRAALSSPLAVLNTAYFMAEANYVGGMSGRSLVIVDECDVLESTVMGFVEFVMSDRMLKTLKIKAPIKGAHKATIIEWIETVAIPAIRSHTAQLALFADDSIQGTRQRKALRQAMEGLRVLARELPDDNWIRDYQQDAPFTFKPIRVDAYAPSTLWRHGDKWLCMSATIISPDTLAESLGVSRDEWSLVRAPMTFPIENRRIVVAPVANMAHKKAATSRPALVLALQRIMDMHPTDRILVHTVSYDLTNYLSSELASDRILTYSGARDRDAVLARFRVQAGAVILAPSLDRGIDLRGDSCRVVVVAKIPFPSLGDSQIGARLHSPGGQTWYVVQTIRTLVQMTGRGVRDKEDWCVTYILDSQFTSNVWKKNRHLLPGWWVEAVDKSFPVRKLMV